MRKRKRKSDSMFTGMWEIYERQSGQSTNKEVEEAQNSLFTMGQDRSVDIEDVFLSIKGIQDLEEESEESSNYGESNNIKEESNDDIESNNEESSDDKYSLFTERMQGLNIFTKNRRKVMIIERAVIMKILYLKKRIKIVKRAIIKIWRTL